MTTLAASLLLLAGARPARAAALPATVSHASGSVTAAKGAATRPAPAGTAVYDGETLTTGPASSAVLVLPDGSKLKLRAGSSLRVSLPAEKGGPVDLLLSAGGVFAAVLKGRREPFLMRTPKAVAAVRGTRFFTAYGRAGREGRDLWLCVDEGAVEVTGADPADTVVVPAGKGILLPGGRKTTEPRPFGWTKGLNWNMDPAAGSVEDSTDLDGAYSDLRQHDYR